MRKKLMVWIVVVGGLLILPMLSGCDSHTEVSSSTTEQTSEDQESEPRDIQATVSFDGEQFIITNLEDEPWINVRFEVNPGLLSSGYTLKVHRIEAKTTYTVGAMQFVNAKGERFNPFTHKPQSFHILDFGTTWPEQYDVEGMGMYGWQ
jgi:hypothetical protein